MSDNDEAALGGQARSHKPRRKSVMLASGTKTSDSDLFVDPETAYLLSSTSSDKHREIIHEEAELRTPKRLLLDFANVLKSFIGSNFLGMPYAFSQAGLYGGMIGIVIIALVTDHCCNLLVQCKNMLPDSEHVRTYGQVGVRVFGKPGRVLVDFFLAFTQLGFCVGYLIFMGQNLNSLLPACVPYSMCVLIPVILALPLSFVKNVKKLGWTSLVADVTLICGMAMLYSFFDLERRHQHKGFNWEGFPLFFGLVTSSYEGIGLVLPVEATMKARPGRYARILHSVLVFVTLLLSCFGVLGYLTFAAETNSVITLNLPESDPVAKATKICLLIAILFTYPMQLFPVSEIFDDILFGRRDAMPARVVVINQQDAASIENGAIAYNKEEAKKNSDDEADQPPPQPEPSYFDWRRNLVRIVLVLFTGLIAVLVPFFGLISGLVGALGSSLLAFLLPILFHLRLCWRELRWWIRVKNFVLLAFGGLALGVGTYYAFKDIVEELGSSLKDEFADEDFGACFR
ncbi:Amino acid transporter transmembrane domain [Balamuthia mandrillaris]